MRIENKVWPMFCWSGEVYLMQRTSVFVPLVQASGPTHLMEGRDYEALVRIIMPLSEPEEGFYYCFCICFDGVVIAAQCTVTC